MELVRKLFGTAGIRMRYPEQFDAILAYRLGLTVAEIVGGRGTGYVVHDTRTTSPLLTLAFMSGLMAGGISAGYIGIAPTPVAAYAALWHGIVGASITASHNPPEYNGLKLYDKDGYEFTRELEVRIESMIDKITAPPWHKVKDFFYAKEIVDEYIEEIVTRLEPERVKFKPKIVVDLANGAAYRVTPTVLRSLGADIITVNANPDGFFPGRSPEPRKDVLENLMPMYTSLSPNIIFAHDGDADRLAVLTPQKGFIRQDRIIAFFAAILLREKKGHVVVSIDTGKVVDHVVEKYGGTIERYKLGKTHERVKELGAQNIVLAAEPWKLIDPRWGPWVDGIWQAALITKTVIEEGRGLEELFKEYEIPDYPWDRRSFVVEPVALRDKVFERLVEELKSALGEPINVITIDGYRYEYDDGSWVLIRKSGTEPKIRFYSEAMTLERLKKIVDTINKLMNNVTKSLGGRITEITIG